MYRESEVDEGTGGQPVLSQVGSPGTYGVGLVMVGSTHGGGGGGGSSMSVVIT